MTGPIGARGLTLTTAAGYTDVIDAILARITTVVIANHPSYGATALEGTLLVWLTAVIVTNYPIRRATAVVCTSAWIFAANAAAKPIFWTAFSRLNANLFIPTADVAANFFLPAAEAAQAHSIGSTVVKVIALDLAIPCVFTPYHTQFFIVHTFKFLWDNRGSIF